MSNPGLAMIKAGTFHIHFFIKDCAIQKVIATPKATKNICRIFSLNGPKSTHISNIQASTCLGTIIFILFKTNSVKIS
jgi:hypothetical protein